ncbi:hypothetical protein L227DRAFT_515230, partial [Lentinus tigrinus ALCF2SS1-6]
PFHLLVDKLCFQKAVHFCTLPRSHLLSSHILHAHANSFSPTRSALHELFGVFGQSKARSPGHQAKNY